MGVVGVPGMTGVAGTDAGAVDSDALCSIVPLKMPRCECRIASDNVVARRMHAHQIVRRTSAVVVPAPNTLSVNPPPNAAPTPCSDDFCISTSTIKNSATNTWITVSIPIKAFILSFCLCVLCGSIHILTLPLSLSRRNQPPSGSRRRPTHRQYRAAPAIPSRWRA